MTTAPNTNFAVFSKTEYTPVILSPLFYWYFLSVAKTFIYSSKGAKVCYICIRLINWGDLYFVHSIPLPSWYKLVYIGARSDQSKYCCSLFTVYKVKYSGSSAHLGSLTFVFLISDFQHLARSSTLNNSQQSAAGIIQHCASNRLYISN